jgi:hypothetical protein
VVPDVAENTENKVTENPGDTTEPEDTPDFQPITLGTQAEVDSFVGGRVKKERAKYADYGELKTKAAELDSLKQASMSQADKDAQRIRELETALETERHANMRRDVAATKKVPADRISGTTREELEASADELLAFIAETVNANKPSRPPTGLKSGATSADTRMDPQERAAAALRTLRSGA